eukprot:4041388-Amphidinium_carterae.1
MGEETSHQNTSHQRVHAIVDLVLWRCGSNFRGFRCLRHATHVEQRNCCQPPPDEVTSSPGGCAQVDGALHRSPSAAVLREVQTRNQSQPRHLVAKQLRATLSCNGCCALNHLHSLSSACANLLQVEAAGWDQSKRPLNKCPLMLFVTQPDNARQTVLERMPGLRRTDTLGQWDSAIALYGNAGGTRRDSLSSHAICHRRWLIHEACLFLISSSSIQPHLVHAIIR